MHPDIVVRYPQSGEVIRGKENYCGALRAFPGTPGLEVHELPGQKDEVIVTSTGFGPPTVTVVGSGDTYVSEGVAVQADGREMRTIGIMRVADAKIIEGTFYSCDPLDPPEWRVPFGE